MDRNEVENGFAGVLFLVALRKESVDRNSPILKGFTGGLSRSP